MQSVQRLVDRFYYGVQDHHHILLVGLDNSGKSALLYLLKLGEFLITIPTPDLNVETVKPVTVSHDGTMHEGPAEMTVCEVVLGLRRKASGEYFLTLCSRYRDGVVWMVNSAESDLFQESVDELNTLLEMIEEDKSARQELNPRPLLILANKQDLPRAKSVGEIRSVFAGILAKRPRSIVLPTSLKRGLGVESGVPQAFDWLQNAIKLSRERVPSIASALTHRVPSLPSHRLQELNTWFSRLKEDVPSDEFLKQFESSSVLRWDHYLRIRVMFHLLQKYGRQEGERMITRGLDKYRSLVADALNGDTLSVTMTSFWVQVVHFAIVNERNPAHSASFTSFIATNPHVINEELWMEYYSKEVMMSQKARDEIALPDKKALPNIIFRSQNLKVP